MCWAWYRFRDLCLRNAANEEDLLTFALPEAVGCLWSEEAEERWWRRRRWRREGRRSKSVFPTPPSPVRAARGGAPSSWKTSTGMTRSRYCHAFFPAVSLSRTSAPNLVTSKRIMFLWPWMAAMWRGVWPLVDLAFTSKVKPAFWTPYLKRSQRVRLFGAPPFPRRPLATTCSPQRVEDPVLPVFGDPVQNREA